MKKHGLPADAFHWEKLDAAFLIFLRPQENFLGTGCVYMAETHATDLFAAYKGGSLSMKKKHTGYGRLLSLLLAVFMVVSVLPTAAFAAEGGIVVDTAEDTVNADDGLTSLREALTQAESGQEITFDEALKDKTLTLASPLQVDKKVSVKLSGQTLEARYDPENGKTDPLSPIIVAKSGNLTLKGSGTVSAAVTASKQNNEPTRCALFVEEGGSLSVGGSVAVSAKDESAYLIVLSTGTKLTLTTGKNISGTSDLAPLDGQAAMFGELLPEVKTVGILYCSAEANSKYQADTVNELLTAAGYTVNVYTFADSNDIANVVTTACSNCDALYIPTDNTAASATETVSNVALPAGIPIICGEEGMCAGCGIATLSISYYDLGTATGKMAVEILKEGKDVSAMEVQFAPTFTKKFNADICSQLGITVPEDYVAIG